MLGMAKAGRRPYVGIVTSGPGGLNTVTALADASRDCAPMGLIAGQVPQDALGTDAFQCTDISDVTRPITKSSRLVESVDQLVESIPRDLDLAASGRPGNVLWDLPKDVQFTPIDLAPYREKIQHYGQFVETPPLDTDALDRAIQLLYESETPVIMAGYGLALAGVFDKFHELLARTKLPVIHTLPGNQPCVAGATTISGCSACTACIRRARPPTMPTSFSRWERDSTTEPSAIRRCSLRRRGVAAPSCTSIP